MVCQIMSTINKYGKPWSKINVTKELRIAVNKIAADQETFVYNLTEKVFREAYPDYFQNQEIKN